MQRCRHSFVLALLLILPAATPSLADDKPADRFQLMDVFQLEHASDPQMSRDGKQVVYVRNFMEIKKDRRRSHLWVINTDGSEHRPVTSGDTNDHSPRWSPDGKRLLYLSGRPGDGTAQLRCRWMDSGQTARLAELPASPMELAWAPDGRSIAFVMHVAERPEPLVPSPPKPEGAEWAEPFKVIQTLNYRHDGKGYLKEGTHHVFVLPADGGTPRQLTKGPHEHRGPLAWTPNAKALLVTANRHPEGEHDPLNTEIYEVAVTDGATKALTSRQGPDGHPAISPDGKQIAYLGFDDKRQGYQVTGLYLMSRDGSSPKLLTGKFDRDVRNPIWSRDGKRVYFQFDDEGNTKVGSIEPLSSKIETVAEHIGGTNLDRPYSSGSFSVADDGTVAFTRTSPDRPADVWVRRAGEAKRLTRLNESLLGHKSLATMEEIRYKSSHDGQPIHGWIIKPPGFDAKKKYPLILEIHGGPFANYGPRFAADMQLYAASGYVVFYANPRGSTSYGEAFGNLIHHAYPGNDYDDLMSGVDAVLKLGYVDSKNLFVTGGSGGGVLSAWIIGKTNRFRAAVVCKPVINWYSFVLTADIYPFFTRNWFPGPPWEHAEHYLKRSPLSLVGNVKTPTMLLTGEADHRTPMSESEQYYQALKLRKVETVLVRVPGASHDIAHRPSHMMAKAAYVLKWFDMHRAADDDSWVSPFNGKNLDGWVARGGKAKYRAEDNQIIGTTVPNTGDSFLCTTKEYADFILELEFKVDPALNSGVQIRSHCFDEDKSVELDGKTIKIPAGRVHGYQVEIDPSERAWTGGIYDEGRRGWLKDLKDNEAARKAFKPNAWNQFRIECKGDSIKTWLNGQAVVDMKDSVTRSGFIGLQVHGVGKKEEPLEVRFRNLRLKELK